MATKREERELTARVARLEQEVEEWKLNVTILYRLLEMFTSTFVKYQKQQGLRDAAQEVALLPKPRDDVQGDKGS